jgi:hypothetical protein
MVLLKYFPGHTEGNYKNKTFRIGIFLAKTGVIAQSQPA